MEVRIINATTLSSLGSARVAWSGRLGTSSLSRLYSPGKTLQEIRIQAVSSFPSVVVTREKGKNQKLIDLLDSHGISNLELPLIEHKEGPDLDMLPSVIQEKTFDWIVITSPEAASVFLEGWKLADFPKARLAVVGVGTGQIFEKVGFKNANLSVDFVPSKANAKNLAEELPKLSSERGKVLYPASAKASHELEMGLSARGFEVVRLNTYSTETVKSIDPSILALAVSAPVVALASPSAVRAWVDVVDLSTWLGAAACIGQTSALAAEKAGFKRVFYPQSPGIDGWLQSIIEALETQTAKEAA
ncbi:hypothetical protein GOP47_0015291 [Adiantum capillus-veneris]|uniref:Uroporphyrinogen-III synthase n=1 Tax=Adiantum capillus-veneris TaxID=13818 RepID=A0A9D4UJI0_ADICA|nr:hypothetical protein GOP47_0015291 [Adiantum capillus-veneris]